MVILLILLCSPVTAQEEIISREGYFVLNFDNYSSKYDTLIIEQTSPDSWQQRFDVTGQRQVTLSGFADGLYQARLTAPGEVEEPVVLASIHVKHHSLNQALTLFGLGLLTFLALVISLITLSRKEHENV
ncbi:hypothetical protein [Saliniradius amylolyticus]|uniref:hypothetical protein n=1 Tax=Saliniradius amylolyticus TaxID=2183582 RepID=UPI0013A5858C|nr:hypothetical protein [Saliniradius amylolyticus]